MIRPRAAAIDAIDEVCVGLRLGEGLEDAFAHGGAADVAEADEEDGDFFGGHGSFLFGGIYDKRMTE
ncbi:hypothetical protein V502_05954 [Pseudogymnoascus sp. VKM F-4520 (FW-2644)]|nr:hypothetical protein V502_05954 [Pseudogymnoascus sp. VKM F-4520 (FW-2644)]